MCDSVLPNPSTTCNIAANEAGGARRALPPWFLACCHREPDSELSLPRSILVDGEHWVMAATNAGAVALRGVGGEPWDNAAARATFARLAPTHRISAEALLARVGPPRGRVPCSECDGEVVVAHMCGCALCQVQTMPCECGDGLEDAPEEYVQILDHVFNAVLLAPLLVEASGELWISVAPNPRGGHFLAIDSPDCRVRIMEMAAQTDAARLRMSAAPTLDLEAL